MTDSELTGIERIRAQGRERQRRFRERKPTSTAIRNFAGVDGEGGNLPVHGDPSDMRHEYLLLRAGDQVLKTGKPLTALECLSFLADLPKDVIYVGYFFDYDVSMILRELPSERLSRLMNRAVRTSRGYNVPMPIEYLGFQFDYLPGKEFKVKREDEPRWTVISDVGSFFQCTFLSALTSWGVGNEEQLASIAASKADRGNFGELTEETIAYNELECDLLVQLMSKFRAVCQGAGYIPVKWQGPGNLAAAMFQKHGIPKKSEIIKTQPWDLWEAANNSYYGGRFETGYVGPVERPIHQWDINSAYPYSMTKLPCLRHGGWEFQYELPTDDSLFLAEGEFSPVEGPRVSFYGFPVRRKNGSIHFPGSGNGYYWSPEIRASIHQRFRPRRVWRYRKNCECVPFSFIPEVYELRRRIGKTSKGMVLKLALNSLYGKLAQSIGGAPYANPIWASLITAYTRAHLQEVIHDPRTCGAGGPCGKDVVMLATDGVFTIDDRPNIQYDPAKPLGGWDHELHEEGMVVIQPGLYFYGDKSVKPKTRGLPMVKVVEYRREFYETWEAVHETGNLGLTVSVPIRSFIGVKLGTFRRKWDGIGQWQHDCPIPKTCPEQGNHIHKSVSFDWSTKRDPAATMDSFNAVRTYPYRGRVDEPNFPYSKEIGAWRDELRIDLVDTSPDDNIQGTLF